MEKKFTFSKIKEKAPDDPELTHSEIPQEYKRTHKSLYEMIAEEEEAKRKNAVQENYKTLLQFSRKIGVEKQRVYRYIKAKNIPVNVINDTIYIDDVAQSKIISDFNKNIDVVKKQQKRTSKTVSNEVKKSTSKDTYKRNFKELQEAFKMLKKELDFKTEQLQEKDRQIIGLTKIIESMTKGSH